MPTNTYVALDKVTISGSSTNTINFNSISSAYTDLVLVTDLTTTGAGASYYCLMRFNSDSGANYSLTNLSGDGSTAISNRNTNQTGVYTSYAQITNPDRVISNINIQNYSNSTTFKTTLVRSNSVGQTSVSTMVCPWRNTNAITSITLTTSANNFGAGSTFSLYGIAATSVGAKATGGDIYTDSQYYYHVFDSTGTFTPSQSLTASVLVVGTGGVGAVYAGGGGAGGSIGYSSSVSLASGTAYTATIGASGTVPKVNSSGNKVQSATASTNCSFSGGSISTITGTAGGNGSDTGAGGSNLSFSGGSGTGGGGAGFGANGSAGAGGAGGAGVSTYSSWGAATGLGQNINGTYWFAGGGGGGTSSGASSGAGGSGGGGNGGADGFSGTAYTGGGGGGAKNSPNYGDGGAGGLGVVMIRYAKV
jgi:hypothetical protein